MFHDDPYSTDGFVEVTVDTVEVQNYYFEEHGICVNKMNNGILRFEVMDVFGFVHVYAEQEDGNILTGSIYAYKTDSGIYLSDISKDQAWYNCMLDRYTKGQISMQEWTEAYSDFSHSVIIGETT